MTLLLPDVRPPWRPRPRPGPPTAPGWRSGPGTRSSATRSSTGGRGTSPGVLGPTRRLVLIEGANRPEALTAYLAALLHGHVALLARGS